MAPVLPLLLFLATLAFALGIVLPLIEVERLFLFSDTPSLLGIVETLFRQGETLLAALIALLSIGFPALKLALLHVAAYGNGAPRVPAWLRALSNWSMLDVVLVALVIFAAKTSGVPSAFARPGLWFFAASVGLPVAAATLRKRRGAASQ